jgi:hypothetical protein
MLTVYSTSQQYTPEQYADALAGQYSQQLGTLYNYGARKVALMGVSRSSAAPTRWHSAPLLLCTPATPPLRLIRRLQAEVWQAVRFGGSVHIGEKEMQNQTKFKCNR